MEGVTRVTLALLIFSILLAWGVQYLDPSPPKNDDAK